MDDQHLRYTNTHEWIDPDGRVGLSDHAQHEITDVVFVELPPVGRALTAQSPCAVVESVKAAFDIYAPVGGAVAAVNEAVLKNPALVNQSPLKEGWLFQVRMDHPADRDALMTADQYRAFLQK